MPDNKALFDAGMDKAHTIIYNHLQDILLDVCESAVTYAMNHHSGFLNFTGNTHTGYACGVYVDGKLIGAVMAASKAKAPVRVKLTAGENDFLRPDYDGRNRPFTGVVDTDGGLGSAYALKFLQSHKPNNSKGLSFCMTTGTEYSLYLEQIRHADVLTGTFTEIPKMLFATLKPIP